jgi:hypothetical protein
MLKAWGATNESILLSFFFTYFLCGSLNRIGLAHMSNPRHLDLVVRQVQDSVDLARMSDLICLDLIGNQVQGIWA